MDSKSIDGDNPKIYYKYVAFYRMIGTHSSSHIYNKCISFKRFPKYYIARVRNVFLLLKNKKKHFDESTS